MLESTLDRRGPELEPLLEQRLEPMHRGPAVEADHVDVRADRALEVGGREQVVHQGVEVGLPLRSQHEARRVLVVRLVAQVLHHRQFLGRHLRGDLLEHLRARRLERQLVDHDLAVLDRIARAQPQRSATALVDLHNLVAARDELAAGREVGALDVLHQLRERRLGLVEQPDQRGRDLAQVVRRHVGRHADGDPARAVE